MEDIHPRQRSSRRRTGSGTNGGWRVLPPVLREYDGPGPEGLLIVGEIDGELGLVLWKMLRVVALWAESEPGERKDLFDSSARLRLASEVNEYSAQDPVLAPDLESLLTVLMNPESAEAAYVARASSRVAAWAADRGAAATQMEFLRVAALAAPQDARYAVEIGGIARDLARYSLAEAWLHRGIGLARGAQDWENYVLAYLKHGVMMARRGTLPAARRSFVKALRRSRRQGLRDGMARALHELMVVEARSGAWTDAFAYASEAIHVHGPGHPRLLQLVHDIAYMCLDSGHSAHALPVFLAAYPRVDPGERPTVLGSIGRAAAGVGDLAAYRWASEQLEGLPAAPGTSEAWVDLARAAFDLDRLEEAAAAARNAETIARARGEGQMRYLAETIMSKLEDARGDAHEPVLTESLPEPSRPDVLTREVLKTLSLDRDAALAGAPG